MTHVSRALSRRVLSGAAVLALAAGLAFVAPASANPAGTGLVISEVYGAGGNVGAVYNADFVELYNPTAAAVNVAGDYIHYRSAGGGGATAPFALTGSVPAGGHYLIQMSATGATGAALPTPDAVATPAFALAAAGGQVYLLSSSTPITTTGNQAGVAGIIDMVGALGSSSFETAPTTAVATATTSLQRSATGADTDDNSADFTTAAPTPENSGTSNPPPPPTQHSIAEIQGTDTDTSPYNGQQVITQGVVTAAYPSGGFFGYVLQTDGTGTGTDATPGASDAVFVYQPSGAVTAHIGDYLEVTGTVNEFSGLTELNVAAADVTDLGAPPLGGVTPLAIPYPTTDAAREAHESELLAPTNEFTVTDNYSTNQYGEIGLATGDHQLVQPTDVYPADDTADIDAVEADNAARLVTLDDGASTNFLSAANQDIPLPWLGTDNPVRIGSTATLHEPVILDFRNSLWKFQPTSPVTDEGRDVVTFSDTRTPNLAPQPVGGNLRLGTFNVLNYFNTTGEDWVNSGHTCTFFNDRAGDPITDNVCSDNGPRGAAQSSGGSDLSNPSADLERQRAKEVKAINTMNADIMSLEEIENSVALGVSNRDDALESLVNALNADAGYTRWAYAPSPDPADLPPTSEQDVIRTAFIYNPDKVSLVGGSVVLSDQSGPGQPFENAREPLAQEFKRKGAQDTDGFLVIVNHLKSKGDSTPPATGDNADGLQGAFNGDRVRQANALVAFANQTAATDGTDKVLLVGDFNSYTQEDPMQVLYGAGYVNQASDDTRDVSYEFDGLAGSLDHVLANPAAAQMVTGRDLWQINAEEQVGFEYSRYNENVTQLYQPDQFRASDHNPEIVGLDAPLTQPLKTTTTKVSRVRMDYGHSAQAVVRVKSPGRGRPTGTVSLSADGQVLGSARLHGGVAVVKIGRDSVPPGTYTLTATYAGDDTYAGSTGTSRLKVVDRHHHRAVTSGGRVQW